MCLCVDKISVTVVDPAIVSWADWVDSPTLTKLKASHGCTKQSASDPGANVH